VANNWDEDLHPRADDGKFTDGHGFSRKAKYAAQLKGALARSPIPVKASLLHDSEQRKVDERTTAITRKRMAMNANRDEKGDLRVDSWRQYMVNDELRREFGERLRANGFEIKSVHAVTDNEAGKGVPVVGYRGIWEDPATGETSTFTVERTPTGAMLVFPPAEAPKMDSTKVGNRAYEDGPGPGNLLSVDDDKLQEQAERIIDMHERLERLGNGRTEVVYPNKEVEAKVAEIKEERETEKREAEEKQEREYQRKLEEKAEQKRRENGEYEDEEEAERYGSNDIESFTDGAFTRADVVAAMTPSDPRFANPDVNISVNGRSMEITASYPGVTYRGGNAEAKCQRTITKHPDGRIEVHNDWFAFDPEFQGKGASKDVARNLTALWDRMGVTEITVLAALENGAYVWARTGFDFPDDYEREKALDKYRGALEKRGLSESAVEKIMEGTKYPWQMAMQRIPFQPSTHPLALNADEAKALAKDIREGGYSGDLQWRATKYGSHVEVLPFGEQFWRKTIGSWNGVIPLDDADHPATKHYRNFIAKGRKREEEAAPTAEEGTFERDKVGLDERLKMARERGERRALSPEKQSGSYSGVTTTLTPEHYARALSALKTAPPGVQAELAAEKKAFVQGVGPVATAVQTGREQYLAAAPEERARYKGGLRQRIDRAPDAESRLYSAKLRGADEKALMLAGARDRGAQTFRNNTRVPEEQIASYDSAVASMKRQAPNERGPGWRASVEQLRSAREGYVGAKRDAAREQAIRDERRAEEQARGLKTTRATGDADAQRAARPGGALGAEFRAGRRVAAQYPLSMRATGSHESPVPERSASEFSAGKVRGNYERYQGQASPAAIAAMRGQNRRPEYIRGYAEAAGIDKSQPINGVSALQYRLDYLTRARENAKANHSSSTIGTIDAKRQALRTASEEAKDAYTTASKRSIDDVRDTVSAYQRLSGPSTSTEIARKEGYLTAKSEREAYKQRLSAAKQEIAQRSATPTMAPPPSADRARGIASGRSLVRAFPQTAGNRMEQFKEQIAREKTYANSDERREYLAGRLAGAQKQVAEKRASGILPPSGSPTEAVPARARDPYFADEFEAGRRSGHDDVKAYPLIMRDRTDSGATKETMGRAIREAEERGSFALAENKRGRLAGVKEKIALKRKRGIIPPRST
jgi:hypothetical protein